MSSYKYRGQTGCPQGIYPFLAFLSVWPNELPAVPFLPNAHDLPPPSVSLSSPPLFILCGQLDQSWVSVVPTRAGVFGVSILLYLAARSL